MCLFTRCEYNRHRHWIEFHEWMDQICEIHVFMLYVDAYTYTYIVVTTTKKTKTLLFIRELIYEKNSSPFAGLIKARGIFGIILYAFVMLRIRFSAFTACWRTAQPHQSKHKPVQSNGMPCPRWGLWMPLSLRSPEVKDKCRPEPEQQRLVWLTAFKIDRTNDENFKLKII